MKLKVLIIGANGFIGKHLSRKLANNSNIDLTLVSRSFSEILKQLESERCKLVRCDYRNTLDMIPILRGQDIVYQLVSSSVPASSWEDPITDIKDNLIASLELFKACSLIGVKKVVFTSSGGTVYGNQSEVLNESNLLSPFSPYGIIKATLEYFLEYFRIKTGMQYDVFRISNAYGPYLNKKGFGVINTWLRLISEKKEIVLQGDGASEKDYIYIDDVVEVLSICVDQSLEQSDNYNLCSGQTTSLNTIIETIKEVCDTDINIKRVSARLSDNRIVRLDNTKIRKRLEDKAMTTLKEGILKTWEYYQSELEQKESIVVR